MRKIFSIALLKMEKERKIISVVKKMTFAEAEKADDKYWAMASVDERLNELISLRKLVFGNSTVKMKKVVLQRSIYEEEN